MESASILDVLFIHFISASAEQAVIHVRVSLVIAFFLSPCRAALKGTK